MTAAAVLLERDVWCTVARLVPLLPEAGSEDPAVVAADIESEGRVPDCTDIALQV